jgi:hypothetical protein
MKYAIELLSNQINELNKPNPEDSEIEEDLIDVVINSRRISDLKLALHVINTSIEMSKVIRFHS